MAAGQIKHKDVKSLKDLAQWHMDQSDHYRQMQLDHIGLADRGDAVRFGIAAMYRVRAAEYDEISKFHTRMSEMIKNVQT